MNKTDKILVTQWKGFSDSLTNIAKTAKKSVSVPTFSQRIITSSDKNSIVAAINSLEGLFSSNCCQSNCCQTCQKCQACQSTGCQTQTCQTCQGCQSCQSCEQCNCHDDGG